MAETSLEKRVNTADQPELTRSGQTYVPLVDIIERDEELLLLADVPGARADGVDINYERGTLTLHARVEPRQTDAHFVLQEYGVGDFVRTFQIGEGIDADKIRAEMTDGVLTLHLPKSQAARTRKIKVQGG